MTAQPIKSMKNSRSTIPPEQKRFLDDRLREHAQKQPEILSLKRLLVGIGGVHVVAPPQHDPDVRWLVEAGFVMAYPVFEKPMQRNECHFNVARLLAAGKIAGVGTGYALFGNLWCEHSWGIRRLRDGSNTIIETTGEREKYFGLIYWGVFARCMFAAGQYECQGLKVPESLTLKGMACVK